MTESGDEVDVEVSFPRRSPDIRNYIEIPEKEGCAENAHSTASSSTRMPSNVEESNLPCTSTTVLPTNTCTPDAHKIFLISEMFPGLENEKISKAVLDTDMNVQQAINQILIGVGMQTRGYC